MTITLSTEQAMKTIQAVIDNIDQYSPLKQPKHGCLRHKATETVICAAMGSLEHWTDFSISLHPKGPTFQFRTNNVNMDAAYLAKNLRDMIEKINTPAFKAEEQHKSEQIRHHKECLAEFTESMYNPEPKMIDTRSGN